MSLPRVVFFILVSFFFHLSANAGGLVELDSELRTLHTRFVNDFVAPAQNKSLQEKLILSKKERDAVIESLGNYKKVFDKIEKKAGSSFSRMGSTRKKNQKRVIAKIMLHAHGAKLFSELLAYPATLGIIKEHKQYGNIPADYAHNLIMDIAKGTHKSIRRENKKQFHQIARPRMADFLSFPKEFSRWVRNFDLPKEQKFLVHQLMEEYLINIRKFSVRQKELITYRVFSKWLYGFKVSAMTWLGDIALPDKNVFNKEYLDKMESQLMPGDIGVINQDGRLSNLVFNGTWSHGLFYLGPYGQMDEVFSSDEETQSLYGKKCKEKGMKCSGFVSYMEEAFAEGFGKYKASYGTEDEITVIEANSEGVVLSTSKYALAFNRITTFRPTLALKDKAMAIEEAFNNYGKPYDFNFDNRTYGRIVCTELILHSYMPDKRVNKDGLEWFMTVVAGTPAMYGYDVVETYFEVPKEQRKLEFLFYYESPRNGDGTVKEMSLKDLRKTVRPDMTLFNDSVHARENVGPLSGR